MRPEVIDVNARRSVEIHGTYLGPVNSFDDLFVWFQRCLFRDFRCILVGGTSDSVALGSRSSMTRARLGDVSRDVDGSDAISEKT
jgi:hypothetical protein